MTRMRDAHDIDDNKTSASGAGRRKRACLTHRPPRKARPSAGQPRPGPVKAQERAVRAGLRGLLAAVGLALLLCLSSQQPSAADATAPAAAIPYGWRVEQAADGLLLVRAPAGDALLTAWSKRLPEGASAEAALQACVNALSGSEPQQRQDKGYQFHFQHEDARHTALFFSAGRRYMLITVSDPAHRYPECMEMLIQSLAQWLKDGQTPAERQSRDN